MTIQVLIAAAFVAVNAVMIAYGVGFMTKTTRKQQMTETYQGIAQAALGKAMSQVMGVGDMVEFVRNKPVFSGSGCASATGLTGINPCIRVTLSEAEVRTLFSLSDLGNAYSNLNEATQVRLKYDLRFYDSNGTQLSGSVNLNNVGYSVLEVHVVPATGNTIFTTNRIATVSTVLAL